MSRVLRVLRVFRALCALRALWFQCFAVVFFSRRCFGLSLQFIVLFEKMSKLRGVENAHTWRHMVRLTQRSTRSTIPPARAGRLVKPNVSEPAAKEIFHEKPKFLFATFSLALFGHFQKLDCMEYRPVFGPGQFE